MTDQSYNNVLLHQENYRALESRAEKGTGINGNSKRNKSVTGGPNGSIIRSTKIFQEIVASRTKAQSTEKRRKLSSKRMNDYLSRFKVQRQLN